MNDLRTQLVATLSFVTDREGFTDPMKLPLTLRMDFRNDRRTADISAFKPLELVPTEVEIPGTGIKIPDTITVRRRSGGVGGFDPDSGEFTLPITFTFDHSLPVVGSSNLALTITTGRSNKGPFDCSGEAADRDQNPVTVKLVATGTFSGGALDGNHAQAVIVGAIDPSPFP